MHRAILFSLALYTMFAQPNLPACWLEQKTCAAHPHPFHHEKIPHSHDYLFDMVLAGSAPALPTVLVSAAILLALVRNMAVFHLIAEQMLGVVDWSPRIPKPPPRISQPAPTKQIWSLSDSTESLIQSSLESIIRQISPENG